jgi:hypothetical protein
MGCYALQQQPFSSCLGDASFCLMCPTLQAARGGSDGDESDITASQQEGRVWLLGEQRWEVVKPKGRTQDGSQGA